MAALALPCIIKVQTLIPATEEYDKVVKVLLRKDLLKSIEKLSPGGQTSGLEGYHSAVIHFAPKMYHFGYNGIMTRQVRHWLVVP
jgi:hypothetical protein